MTDLTIIEQVGLITFACAAFKYIVLDKLSNALDTLNVNIENMQKTLDKLHDNQHALDKRLAVLETSIKSAHKRIDELGE